METAHRPLFWESFVGALYPETSQVLEIRCGLNSTVMTVIEDLDI